MNEPELRRFEAELQSLRPRQLPVSARQRLMALMPSRGSSQPTVAGWRLSYLRWLIPASAVTGLAALVFSHGSLFPTQRAAPALIASSKTVPLKADKVEIDRQLLAHFDAVGRLPDGQPVRFRCVQWMDNVRVSDSAAGLLIERSAPRLEITPVGFETY